MTETHTPETLPSNPCEWFALCTNYAAGTVDHPILGDVPTCERCAELAGEDLQPFGSPWWIAGWNVPGYLPDSMPAKFATHEDARRYLITEMLSIAESSDDLAEDDREALTSAAEDVNLWSGCDSLTIRNAIGSLDLAFWIDVQ